MKNDDNQIDGQSVVGDIQPEIQSISDADSRSELLDKESVKKQKSKIIYFIYGAVVGLLSLAVIPIILLLSIRSTPPLPDNSNGSASNELGELGYNVYIYEPDNNAHILQGDPVLLKGGVVKTTTQDIFWQYNMTWNSDIQGFLGRGKDLTYKYLNPGEHKITFSAESNNGSKSSAEIIIVVKSDSSIIEPELSQYLSQCKLENKYTDCLYAIIPKLAVWNKDVAVKLIDENESDRTLKSVYEGVIYNYAQSTFNPDLCSELTDKEFLEGCYVSIATDTKKPEFCELAGSRVGNCYHWVSSAMRDKTYCAKADNPSNCVENVNKNIGKDPYFNL